VVDPVLAAARERVRGVLVAASGRLGRGSGAGVLRAVTHDRGHDRDAHPRRRSLVGDAPDLRRIFVATGRDTRTVALSTGQTIDFSYPQPCTPPQFFDAAHANPRQAPGGTPADAQWYEPHLDLKAHYLSRAVAPPPEKFGDDPCGESSKTHELNLGQEWPHGPFGGGR